jgi:predicted RecA/RadA family phage recombinase
MQNYRREGKSLRAPSADALKSGDLAVIGDIVGVATNDIVAGATGIFHVEGVYRLSKGTTEAIPVGKRVYLTSAGLITATVSTNAVAGVAWESASAAASTILVKINV